MQKGDRLARRACAIAAYTYLQQKCTTRDVCIATASLGVHSKAQGSNFRACTVRMKTKKVQQWRSARIAALQRTLTRVLMVTQWLGHAPGRSRNENDPKLKIAHYFFGKLKRLESEREWRRHWEHLSLLAQDGVSLTQLCWHTSFQLVVERSIDGFSGWPW